MGKHIGNYEVVRQIGQGGMATVYLGRHPELHSKVAIKVLHHRHASSMSMVQRFRGEARVVNRIGHPGIVRIHDGGYQEDVGIYLVMEYLEGLPLNRRCEGKLPLSLQLATRYTLQAASALAACHREGVIHRDLKPANLFVVSDPDVPGGERLKVLDFGIAKMSGAISGMAHTQTGMLVGSPRYMAPEQCLDSRTVDQRADIYALGIIFYQLVTGEQPFKAETLGQLILMQQQTRPQAPSELNSAVGLELDEALLRALERDPDDRFQSMDQFREALCDAVFCSVYEEQQKTEVAVQPLGESDPPPRPLSSVDVLMPVATTDSTVPEPAPLFGVGEPAAESPAERSPAPLAIRIDGAQQAMHTALVRVTDDSIPPLYPDESSAELPAPEDFGPNLGTRIVADPSDRPQTHSAGGRALLLFAVGLVLITAITSLIMYI